MPAGLRHAPIARPVVIQAKHCHLVILVMGFKLVARREFVRGCLHALFELLYIYTVYLLSIYLTVKR